MRVRRSSVRLPETVPADIWHQSRTTRGMDSSSAPPGGGHRRKRRVSPSPAPRRGRREIIVHRNVTENTAAGTQFPMLVGKLGNGLCFGCARLPLPLPRLIVYGVHGANTEKQKGQVISDDSTGDIGCACMYTCKYTSRR